MNNFDKLLEGVLIEWKPICNSLVRTKGTSITAGKMKELNKDGAPLKVFAGGKTTAYVEFSDIPEKDVTKEPSIIVKSRGIIEFEYYDKPFSHKNEMWAYHSTNEYLNIKYVYYYLKMNESYFQNIGNRMQMPQISTPDTDKYLIPIPCPKNPEKSLTIQSEIVRILDKFSTLTAELQAELQARKSQYKYYRDQLLNYPMELADQLSLRLSRSANSIQNDGNPSLQTFAPNPQTCNSVLQPYKKVEWMNLGDVAEIGTGSHDTQDAIGDGEYTFFARGREPLRLNVFDFDETAIITAGDGVGVGKVFHYAQGKYALHQRAYRIVPDVGINARFLYHYISSYFYAYIQKTAVSSSVTSLRRPMFIKFPIPVPPLPEQERIVSILDKFDTLTNSISEGLPKEIELRQKQYEYYRDMLLTFPQQ